MDTQVKMIMVWVGAFAMDNCPWIVPDLSRPPVVARFPWSCTGRKELWLTCLFNTGHVRFDAQPCSLNAEKRLWSVSTQLFQTAG